MYFNKSMGTVEEDTEPFSLTAFAISKGKTAKISEVTPKLFEDRQEVKLKKIYEGILDEFKTKLKYKKYFSAWTVVGASWNIGERRWYYMIRHHSIFVWVNEDQIEKVDTVQTQIIKGTPKETFRNHKIRLREGWVRGQQSLDPNDKGWKAGSCEEKLRERLKRRK